MTGKGSLAVFLTRAFMLALLVCGGFASAAVAQPAATPQAAPAASAAPAAQMPPTPTVSYNPAGLFADENSTGSLAICAAEGNCDINATKRPSYYGHNDPGNGYRNYGWCSANTRYYPGASSDNGVGACREHTRLGVRRAIEEMRKYGFSPEDQMNIEILINYVDAHNQAHPDVASHYMKVLASLCNPGTKCSTQNILTARYRGCVDLGCNDGAGQQRRVSAIASVIAGGPVQVGDPGSIGGAGGFADLQVTLIEKVQALQCWSCGIVQAVTRIAHSLGQQVFDVLRESLMALLAAILGIYLVYHAMRVLLPFGPASAIAGVFNQIALVTGMSLLVMTLLASMTFYWDYIYRPVLTGSMDASMTILQTSGVAFPGQGCNYNGIPDDIVPMAQQVAGQMTCLTRAINETISAGTRVGWAMIVGAGAQQKKEPYKLSNPLITLPNGLKIILLWISGLILMGVFIYASFAFLWVVIDIVYRWTFVSVISPLVIASFAFRETRKFSGFAFRGLMESFVALILSSIVAIITVKLVERTGFDPRTTSGTVIEGGIESYIEKLANADAAIRAPTLNTTVFWSLATIGMLCGSLMFKMKDLASYLTSSALGGWATETGARMNYLGMATGALNQVTGRFTSRGMTRYLEWRYNNKFTDATGAKMKFVRPRWASRI